LALHPVDLSTLVVKLRLVSPDLFVLSLVLYLLALHLIANQSAGTGPKTGPNECPGSRATDCASNDSACSSPAQRSNTCTFLTRCERAASTADDSDSHDSDDKNGERLSLDAYDAVHISSFFPQPYERDYSSC
jgi:hypothetical protein